MLYQDKEDPGLCELLLYCLKWWSPALSIVLALFNIIYWAENVIDNWSGTNDWFKPLQKGIFIAEIVHLILFILTIVIIWKCRWGFPIFFWINLINYFLFILYSLFLIFGTAIYMWVNPDMCDRKWKMVMTMLIMLVEGWNIIYGSWKDMAEIHKLRRIYYAELKSNRYK